VLKSGERAKYGAALCAFGEILPRDEEAISLFIEGLKVEDCENTAAQALGMIGPEARKAVPALAAKLTLGRKWIVKCAAIALGRIGPEAMDSIPALTTLLEKGENYRVDAARALWKIDPRRSAEIVPKVVAILEEQRSGQGSNEPMDSDFFSAMELMGEMGPEARAAVPVLRRNLKGGAKARAAWALWRIQPDLREEMAPIIAEPLNPAETKPDRLDRLTVHPVRSPHHIRPRLYAPADLALAGALWQMYPEKKEELRPFIVNLLYQWEENRTGRDIEPEAVAAMPALEDLAKNSTEPLDRRLTQDALRKIRASDFGNW
jgi:hypothetical protein